MTDDLKSLALAEAEEAGRLGWNEDQQCGLDAFHAKENAETCAARARELA